MSYILKQIPRISTGRQPSQKRVSKTEIMFADVRESRDRVEPQREGFLRPDQLWRSSCSNFKGISPLSYTADCGRALNFKGKRREDSDETDVDTVREDES